MILLRLRTNRSLLLFIVLTGVLFASIPFSATTAPAAYKSAILIDYDTGQILYEENAHDPLIPASMVKLMVLFLVMEQLEAGNLHLSDQVTASEWAAKMGRPTDTFSKRRNLHASGNVGCHGNCVGQ